MARTLKIPPFFETELIKKFLRSKKDHTEHALRLKKCYSRKLTLQTILAFNKEPDDDFRFFVLLVFWSRTVGLFVVIFVDFRLI